MKKLFIVLSLSVLSLQVFSQSQEWTKDDRNNIYNEYMDALTKYKNITNDQKQSIALCCMQEITKKYTKKDFQEKIDIELKRIQDATIIQCAKNIGVDLSTQNNNIEEPKKSQDVKSSYKKEDFNGIWVSEDGDYTFHSDDGEYKLKSPKHQNEAIGKWYLDGKTLILKQSNLMTPWSSGQFEIVSVSSDEIVLKRETNSEICHLKKQN